MHIRGQYNATLCVSLPVELAARVERAARENKQKKSALVAELLYEAFDERERVETMLNEEAKKYDVEN